MVSKCPCGFFFKGNLYIVTFSEESISIEETNKLRASLGLAPLEIDSGSKEQEVEGGEGVEKIYKEDGMEFVHKKAEHMGEKKRVEEMREKLQVWFLHHKF